MALLAILIAGGGLLWHILACMESPMAFSPDGKTLAFVTIEPLGDLDEQPLPGEHAFRLMVLGDDRKVRVLEQSVDELLTAPGFSPDGKRLCYLRVPLRTPAQMAAVEEKIKRYEQAVQQAEQAPATAPSTETPGAASPPAAASAPAAGEPSLEEDLSLPSFRSLAEFLSKTRMLDPLICTLVERDLSTGRIVSTTRFPAVVPPITNGSPDMTRYIYGLARPQYSPDGQWIYATLGERSYRVELASGKTALIAASSGPGVLSPDGKTVAILTDGAIQLWSTDGRMATYLRFSDEPMFNGLAWIDARTLGVLLAKPQPREVPPAQTRASTTQAGTTQEPTELVIRRLRVDGSTLEPIRITLPSGASGPEGLVDLAISPDGRHVVIASNKDVLFTTISGQVLRRLQNEEKTALEQPAFSPDSRRVALKQIADEPGNITRVTAIVFFTPDGQEQYRVPVPPIPPGTTRPATQPATQPAAAK
jgi:hypothetical protein